MGGGAAVCHCSAASSPPLPSSQLCIIGPGSDGLLLPQIVTPHPSPALTRERKKTWKKEMERDGRWKGQTPEEAHVSLPI